MGGWQNARVNREKNMTVRRMWGSVARRAAPIVVSGVWLCTIVVPAQAALAGQTVSAMAAGTGDVPAAATAQKRRKLKKVKPATPPERMPSGETVADRERRLTRECKGRPNAGACLGFAS